MTIIMKQIYLIGLIFLLGFPHIHAQQSDGTLTIMTYNLYRDFESNTQTVIPEFAKVIAIQTLFLCGKSGYRQFVSEFSYR